MTPITKSRIQSRDSNLDLVGDWCEFHHNLNDISQPRRVMQLRVLRELEAAVGGPVELIDAGDLEGYLDGMIRRGYHPHTLHRNLRMIRPFLRWLWQHDMIDAERWLRLKAVRGPRGAYDGKPRPYNPQQIRRFWIELDARYPWTYDKQPRMRTPERGEYWVRRWAGGLSRWHRVYPYARRLQVEAITALALYGGLRRDEIYGIALGDMHYENEYVPVRSRKGAEATEKLRVVAMNPAMRIALGNWIEFRAQVLAPDHDFPWLCLWAPVGVTKPMTHTQFQGLLTKIGRGWEFHRLRHTFGTARYAAGMPIEILQEVLGHSSIKQTLGYTKIDIDKVLQVSHDTDERFLKAVQTGRQAANGATAGSVGSGSS